MGAALKLIEGGLDETGDRGPKIPLEQHFREALEWFACREDLEEGREPTPRILSSRRRTGPASDLVRNFRRRIDARTPNLLNPVVSAIVAFENGDKAPWEQITRDLKETGIFVNPVFRQAADTVNGGTRQIFAQINQVF